MAEIVGAVHPTRMELLGMKKRIKLAEKGHRILREKRDALIMEFFKVVDKARTARVELVGTMRQSYGNLIRAEAIMGPTEVESIATSIRAVKDVNVRTENIMGIHVPKLELVEGQPLKETLDKGGAAAQVQTQAQAYSMASTSSTLDDTITDFNKALQQIILLVEAEETVRLLSDEIKKTKRRVNALEYVMLPRLKSTRKYIQMRLEELERENFFRLKTVKKKRK